MARIAIIAITIIISIRVNPLRDDESFEKVREKIIGINCVVLSSRGNERSLVLKVQSDIDFLSIITHKGFLTAFEMTSMFSSAIVSHKTNLSSED